MKEECGYKVVRRESSLESEEAGARAPVFFIKINKFKYIDMKNSVFEENSVAYDEWF